MAVRKAQLSNLFTVFFKSSQSGGLLRLLCTCISLIIANTQLGEAYKELWHTPLGIHLGGFHLTHSVVDWINDGLMTVFFLLVGLEIERELYIGEISSRKKAMLPVMGAIGGMLVPALIYLAINFNNPLTIKGGGIPTATDIAFAIDIMCLLGDKVPASLKVFLTALAIIDDLGAIFIIAIFYGSGFSVLYLTLSACLFGLLLLLNRLKVNSLWVYIPLGVLLWFFMMHSGLHATLAGVLLAFAIPFENGAKHTSSYRLEKSLQFPVALFVIPLFALANTAITIKTSLLSQLLSAESLGIFFGLVLGKPVGIFFAAVLSKKLNIAELPKEISKSMLWGAGMLGGIGFTMAIFVTNLAFENKELIELGKITILIASATASVGGYLMLAASKKSKNK
ncbi:MAG: Na+/H+ antiporter NhaA [Bacteroidia bacterium]|nr:Na+/H+ antiporter NhaA [Bacteroidia bacterium]